MTLFYSPSTNAFYDDAIHGARTVVIFDPAWTVPMISVPDPAWRRPTVLVPDVNWERPSKRIPDPDWVRPTKLVPDPDDLREMIEVPDDDAEAPPLLVLDDEAERPLVEVLDLTVVHPTIMVADPAAEHPQIEVENPDCRLPDDAVPISREEHAQLLEAQAEGKRIAAGPDGQPTAEDRPAPTADELKAILTNVVQNHLDAQAQALGFDSIFTAVTYADEPSVPTFQAHGLALRAWRSAVWERCYEIFEEVTSGMSLPPTRDELIAELPAFSA